MLSTIANSAGTESTGRERIMDVAAAAFLAHGYEAASLRQIADQAGMKAGSLYYHFSSKDDLLTEILRRGIDVMNTAFDAAEATPTVAGRDRVGVHVRFHLAALFENGPYTAVHVTTFRTSPESVRAEVVKLRDAYEARWTALLSDLRDASLITSDVPVTLARLALFGAMNASVEWFDPNQGDLDTFAAAITRQFWNGVAA